MFKQLTALFMQILFSLRPHSSLGWGLALRGGVCLLFVSFCLSAGVKLSLANPASSANSARPLAVEGGGSDQLAIQSPAQPLGQLPVQGFNKQTSSLQAEYSSNTDSVSPPVPPGPLGESPQNHNLAANQANNPGDIEPSFIIKRFYLAGNDSLLTARLNLSVTEMQYLRDILRDGARLSLQCNTALYRHRSILTNVLINEQQFSASLRYNPLQREFVIFSENRPPIVNASLTELLQQTWGNLELPLVKRSELEKEETYVAVLTLTLKHEEMPPWLGKNVLFWSDLVIAPKEYKLEFEY